MTPVPIHVKRTAIALTLFAMMTTVMGCQQYGDVSPKSYEFATALYSICNRKDEVRLKRVEKSINEAVETEALPAHEADHLRNIIKQANDGHWTAAMQASRTIMSEQNKAQ